MAGTYGALGVVAALNARDRDGGGQVVHTSLLSGVIGIHGFQASRWLVAGQVPGISGNHHPTVAPYGLFETATAPIVIAVGNDPIWRRFAPLIGLDSDDPRFVTNADRIQRRSELEALISDAFALRSATDWLQLLVDAAVPAGEVRSLDRVYEWDQVRNQGLVVTVDHPTLGPIELPGSPIRFGRTASPAPTAPPTLGQHTEAIAAERIGS
jgi:formyl-CoA transferase